MRFAVQTTLFMAALAVRTYEQLQDVKRADINMRNKDNIYSRYGQRRHNMYISGDGKTSILLQDEKRTDFYVDPWLSLENMHKDEAISTPFSTASTHFVSKEGNEQSVFIAYSEPNERGKVSIKKIDRNTKGVLGFWFNHDVSFSENVFSVCGHNDDYHYVIMVKGSQSRSSTLQLHSWWTEGHSMNKKLFANVQISHPVDRVEFVHIGDIEGRIRIIAAAFSKFGNKCSVCMFTKTSYRLWNAKSTPTIFEGSAVSVIWLEGRVGVLIYSECRHLYEFQVYGDGKLISTLTFFAIPGEFPSIVAAPMPQGRVMFYCQNIYNLDGKYIQNVHTCLLNGDRFLLFHNNGCHPFKKKMYDGVATILKVCGNRLSLLTKLKDGVIVITGLFRDKGEEPDMPINFLVCDDTGHPSSLQRVPLFTNPPALPLERSNVPSIDVHVSPGDDMFSNTNNEDVDEYVTDNVTGHDSVPLPDKKAQTFPTRDYTRKDDDMFSNTNNEDVDEYVNVTGHDSVPLPDKRAPRVPPRDYFGKDDDMFSNTNNEDVDEYVTDNVTGRDSVPLPDKRAPRVPPRDHFRKEDTEMLKNWVIE